MNKQNSTVLIYIFIVSFLELILTFLIKYDLNGISIDEFSLFYIGNILPIAIEVFLLLLVIGQLLRKGNISALHRGVLFLLATISFILLLASYLTQKLGFTFPTEYIFNYPYSRVVPGIAQMLSFSTKIFLITLLLNLFFNNGAIVYLKSLFTTIFVFVVAFATIFVFTTKKSYSSIGVKPASNRIAVVLGAAVWSDKPSTLLKGRTRKAEQLLRGKKISKIQFTGSNAPGEISEAKAAYNYARSLGIKKHLMNTEEKTTTTTEQIKFIKNNLLKNKKYTSLIIISDQFHLTRVLEICKFFSVKAVGVASDYKLKSEKLLYYRLRESIALLFFWLFAI